MNRTEELSVKRAKLREYLKAHNLDAAMLSSQAYFAWYTCGGDNHVVMASEGGVASVLAGGEKDVVITANIEAGRMTAEEVGDLPGFEVVGVPWQDNAKMAEEIAKRTAGKRVATDSPGFGLAALPGDFGQLTWVLTPAEIARYRALGKECSAIIEDACRKAKRGDTEHVVGSRLGGACLAAGIVPNVVLIAADDRILNFRHPIPTKNKVKHTLMAVLCGKRSGLIVSCTRLVHFGKKLPEDLARKHAAVVQVDAAFNVGSKPGRDVGAIFREALAVYAETGFADEWTLHHQGGACGYQGRSYKGAADCKLAVLENQAFAWNPSITGTKSEDTILAGADGPEFLSKPSSKWPTIKVTRGGVTLKRADILCL